MANPNQNQQQNDPQRGGQQQSNPGRDQQGGGQDKPGQQQQQDPNRRISRARVAGWPRQSGSLTVHSVLRKPRRKAGFSCVGGSRRIFSLAGLPYAGAMPSANALPLFHLFGDPPDDKAFDFIHVEPLVSRSSAHDWRIPAHRHRDLFQIFLVERGGGEMTYEAAILPSRRRPRC